MNSFNAFSLVLWLSFISLLFFPTSIVSFLIVISPKVLAEKISCGFQSRAGIWRFDASGSVLIAVSNPRRQHVIESEAPGHNVQRLPEVATEGSNLDRATKGAKTGSRC